MAYYGSWKIDDLLTFACNTHTVTTGAGTDADSVPTYRVYEDETGTAILNGSMAKLDDANTVGFYSEQITLSAANGFEKGKCYTIYISATVNSVAGTMHHNFQLEAEVDANSVSNIGAGVITASAIANGAIDAATFAADVDAEILSYLVDDATRIDASALNTAAVTSIPAILEDTSTTLDDLVDNIEARLGTPSDLGSGATIAANLVDIEGQTDDIGAAGAGLTAADDAILTAIAALNNLSAAQVNTEVDTALADINLDHLVKSAVDTDFPTTVHLNSVIGHLADNDTTATYDRTTDSLEAQQAEHDSTQSSISGLNNITAAQVRTEMDSNSTKLAAILEDTGTTLQAEVDGIQADTEDIQSRLPAALTGDGNIKADALKLNGAAPNNLSAAQVNTEADTALADAGVTTTVTGRIDAAISTRASQTSVDDLPTNAELATSQAAADDTTLAAIAALNNLSAAQVNAEVVDALTVDVIADSVAADGSRPTVAQAVLMMLRFLTEKSVSGTTVTVKKEDGSTSSMTFTLDDGSAPTSITRAS